MEDPKNPLFSKSIWLGVVVALAPLVSILVPGAEDFIKANIEVIGGVVGALIVVLRFLTKKPVV